MSALPTTLPARSRASWPATKTRRRPSTATTWEYRVWPLRTGAASASGWMFLRVTVMVVSFLCRLAPSGGAAGERTADRQAMTHGLVESHGGVVGGRADAVEHLAEEAAGGGGQRDIQDLGVGESVAAQSFDVLAGHGVRTGRDLLRERHHRDLGRWEPGLTVVAGDRVHLLVREDPAAEQHGSVREHSVATPELRGGRERDQLVPPLIHRRADGLDQIAPGGPDLGPKREYLRVVRDVAERLQIALVGVSHGAGGLLERNLVDERHVAPPQGGTPRRRPVRLAGSGGPVIPRARREPDGQLHVVVEHEALRDEGLAGAADALEIVVARAVALLDGRARVAARFALATGAGEWNGRAGEDQALGLAADRRVPEGPSGGGAERHRDLRQRDAAGLVAVGVDGRDERAARRAGPRGERGEVEPARSRVVARIVGGGDAIEHRVEGLERHRGAVGETRVTARRRLDPLGDPAVHVDEAGAQERRVVDRVPQVLRVLRRLRRVGRGELLGGRGPDTEAVLGPGKVVDARRRPGRDIARTLGVRMGERGVAPVIFGRAVRVENLQGASARREPPVQVLVGGGLDVVHHVRPVLRVLAEPLVELAAETAGDVRDDPVERFAAVLVEIQIVVDERAQQTSGLRAPIRVHGP